MGRRPLAITGGIVLSGLIAPARAADVPVPPPVAPTAPASVQAPAGTPPALQPEPSGIVSASADLAAADGAIAAGDLERAKLLFQRVADQNPGTPEAAEALRALRILAAARRSSSSSAATVLAAGERVQVSDGGTDAPPTGDGASGVVMRREPYSLRTSERLRLTTWEKLDFGVTSFLYGMSVGLSFSLGQGEGDVGPVALGALGYTLGAVAYLSMGKPDRGDLPLALAITSYLPTTTLLAASVAYDNPDGRKVSYAMAGTGIAAIPLAILATRKLDLDPGDTQLVRDAGFWGLVLATGGTMGFAGETSSDQFGSRYREPSARTIGAAGLLGLYGGLGLGAIAAASSEVSLERIRVTTWGGYGGGVLGVLLSGSSSNPERDIFRGFTVGAALGLAVTFLATRGLDGIPPEDSPPAAPRASVLRSLMPAMTAIAQPDGRAVPTFGLSGTL